MALFLYFYIDILTGKHFLIANSINEHCLCWEQRHLILTSTLIFVMCHYDYAFYSVHHSLLCSEETGRLEETGFIILELFLRWVIRFWYGNYLLIWPWTTVSYRNNGCDVMLINHLKNVNHFITGAFHTSFLKYKGAKRRIMILYLPGVRVY